MKRIKVGDYAETYDGIGSGFITWVGIGYVEINNHVDINLYEMSDIEVFK